jgi:manganese-dependent ADP-ribose/CDP-alcohol diphosphatase
MKNISRLILSPFFLLFLYFSSQGQDQRPVRIGIFTDCQYCNCEQSGQRYYRLSLEKLDSCVRKFNAESLNGVFHLGDMIDHGFGNYDSVLPWFRRIQAPSHLVLGNHDYMIKSKYKSGLKDYIGMTEDHYRTDIGEWTFIVLNGDDLSYFAPQSRKQKQERKDLINDLYSSLELNGMIWNGGISSEQMRWIDDQLSVAQAENRKVVILCHFPLFSKNDHNLYNRYEVFNMIDKFSCVKAYFNGHYHAGNYVKKNGIHLVNFKGMVDTKENAYSIVTLTSDSIFIKGYGRETDRNLGIR